ncbi:protein ZINC INDUCED FACILITATOR 1-like isoform X2 [Mangifera indica]|uniref:protein ZINC INDUCED FACILITATOR 1-like isoform X2 n=1 Tax=Mangifera indica TaxID=29780 RepID=UPI001CFA1B0E|nr:protein ZINC INDUCED FACILITATOR 1-like isoform X2 [Mangifera indica]
MSEEQCTETPLKNKKYYENCPGCQVDKLKELKQGLPIQEIVSLWFVAVCNALSISSLFPFLYFMIRDFHIAKREGDIGYYAGFVGSSYMIGRALTSVLWGLVADHYGRKPVILSGTISVVILSTLFGLSINFWMALITRFLLGSMNALLGTITAYAVEVMREEHQALGLSTVCTAWGIGLIMGPAVGGFLAQPAEKYPYIFSKESLFAKFAYFLPCFVMSLIALGVTIASCWLPETLHIHNEDDVSCDFSNDDMESASCGSDAYHKEHEGSKKTSKGNLIKNWPLMSSIIVHSIVALNDMAYTEIFSLWAVSPRRYGGLYYSTEDVGEVLAISGLCLLVFQFTVYPMLSNIFGHIVLARIAGVLTIPLLTSYTFIAKLSGFSLALSINCASALKNILIVAMETGLSLLQNRAVEQHQRGAANGIAITTMSLFKAAGPAGGGALLSWAQKRQDAVFLPGDQMIFFMLNVVMAIAVILSFKPFLT